MNGNTNPTFAEVLDRVRELAALGLSWEETWGSVETPFRCLSSRLTPEERARAFERLLAAFTSDTDGPVEPVGRFCLAGEVGQ